MIEIPRRLLDEIETDCRRLYGGVTSSDADYRQIARDACLGVLRRKVEWLGHLRLVNLVIGLGGRLHWETPLVLTVRKHR